MPIPVSVDYRYRGRSGCWRKAQAIMSVPTKSAELIKAELSNRHPKCTVEIGTVEWFGAI